VSPATSRSTRTPQRDRRRPQLPQPHGPRPRPARSTCDHPTVPSPTTGRSPTQPGTRHSPRHTLETAEPPRRADPLGQRLRAARAEGVRRSRVAGASSTTRHLGAEGWSPVLEVACGTGPLSTALSGRRSFTSAAEAPGQKAARNPPPSGLRPLPTAMTTRRRRSLRCSVCPKRCPKRPHRPGKAPVQRRFRWSAWWTLPNRTGDLRLESRTGRFRVPPRYLSMPCVTCGNVSAELSSTLAVQHPCSTLRVPGVAHRCRLTGMAGHRRVGVPASGRTTLPEKTLWSTEDGNRERDAGALLILPLARATATRLDERGEVSAAGVPRPVKWRMTSRAGSARHWSPAPGR